MSNYNSQIARFRAVKNAYIPMTSTSSRQYQNNSIIKNQFNNRQRQFTPKQSYYNRQKYYNKQKFGHQQIYSNNHPSFYNQNQIVNSVNNINSNTNQSNVNNPNRSFLQFKQYQPNQYNNSNENSGNNIVHTKNKPNIQEKLRSTRGSTHGISSDSSYIKDSQRESSKKVRQNVNKDRHIIQNQQRQRILNQSIQRQALQKKNQINSSIFNIQQQNKHISLELGVTINSSSTTHKRQIPQNFQSYTHRNFQYPSNYFSSSHNINQNESISNNSNNSSNQYHIISSSFGKYKRNAQTPNLNLLKEPIDMKALENSEKYISINDINQNIKSNNYISKNSSFLQDHKNSQKVSQQQFNQFTKQQIHQDIKQQTQKTKYKYQNQQKYNFLSCNIITKHNFQTICPVGKGGFGKVWKVIMKRNKQIYAMKEMYKAKIIQKKSINSVMNEKSLLSKLRHPFLINMNYAFQDRQNLYLIMDYINGGDLRYHLGKYRRFPEAQSKFFMANIIIGLQYLHTNNIIHRDIKPENLVFGSDGYLHITDLGISRQLRQNNYQDTSGTPGYMSPQVICRKNHSFQTDFFALGVIGYELMLGKRPYNGRNRKQIRQVILSKQAGVKLDQLPKDWSAQGADFINRLLIRTPANRLGSNGIHQLKNHVWMKNVNWNEFIKKQITPSYIPLSIEDDYEEYRKQISQDTIPDNYQQNLLMLRDNNVQSLFQGYNYTNKVQYK